MAMRALLALVLVLASGLSARAEGTGAEAYAARDFATAEALWTEEARAGSAEAMLGLGLLADYGLLGPRSGDQAFAWYSRAAEAGSAEAQFNLAVMFDAGRDRPRDAEAAALWYTRAALRDHARAQFNLALLYEAGDGVPRAGAAATYWFDAAATELPAAAERAGTSPSDEDDPALARQDPRLLHAGGDDRALELVWLPGGGPDAPLEIEVLPAGAEGYPQAERLDAATGTGPLLPRAGADSLARLILLDPAASDYRASDWKGAGPGPKGRIRLQFDTGDARLLHAAGIFGEDLIAAGFWVRDDAARGGAIPATAAVTIAYRYRSDAAMAEALAAYLPAAVTAFDPEASTLAPGEVAIRLVDLAQN